MNPVYEIAVVVELKPFSGHEEAEAKLVAGVIRDKIRKAMENHPQVVKWQVTTPNKISISDETN